MSPGSNVPRQAEEPRFEWVHIDDFTPGVYDNSFISLAEPKLSAPLGSADAIATWCCAAIGQNGLGPLPALTTTASDTPALPGTSDNAFLTGFAVNPGLDSAVDELIIIFECDDGTTRHLRGYSDVPMGPFLNGILAVDAPTQVGIFGSPYPSWTRMNATGAPAVPPAAPVLVFPAALNNDARGPDGHLYIYPPIATPTVFAVQDLITGTSAGMNNSSITGQVVTYGSRVICLVGINYPWPAGGGVNTNQIINFTDPPQSAIYLNQEDIITAEEPWGYGAFGTISVGELFIIKKNGGGVIVYGDIDAVTSVVSMPGVQSTGDFVGKASAGPLGLVYCSEQRGAWTWNGGNTAQKISAQLRDNFYDATTQTGMQGNNYGFLSYHWQNWILFSNNYMYDLDTGSWWQFYPGDNNNGTSTTGHTFFWWYEGRFGNQMYAAPLKFGTAAGLTDVWWYMFDSKVPAPHWQWQSLPIHVDANADRVLDVRQVVVRLSDPSGSTHATATVTVAGTNIGTIPNVSEGPAVIGTTPQAFRLNCGVRTSDIVIKIQGDNAVSGSSPIVHSIDIGYQIRESQGVSN